MMYRSSYRQVLAVLVVGLWAGMAGVSCAPEFTDEQCATDQDCFPDEFCSAQGICQPGAGGDVGPDVEQDADTVEIASIEVTPQSVDVALGLTVPLDATAFDADGNEIADATFEWESSDEVVATVNADGEVTGLEIGTATITVTSTEDPSVQATASITVVEGEVDTVTVEPSAVTLIVGETQTLTATALNEAGEEISDPQVTWTSDDESIATVDTDGTVTAVAAGQTTITATVEGVQATVDVEVQLVPVARIELTPADPTVEVGSTVELTAQAFDAEDNELTGRQITWTSDDESIATIDSGGIVTGVAEGTVTITAEIGGETATVDVDVVPANTSPVADAGADQVVSVGDTVTLDASNSDDADNDTLTYSWTFSSQPTNSTATLSDASAVQPTFTADVAGDYVLELTVDDGSATATDTVTITANTPPVADAGSDQTVTEGDTVTLDGSNSSDADGDTLSYSWTFTSTPTGSSAALSDSTAASPTFTPDVAGDYVLELTVDDGNATATDTVTITAEAANTAPTADAGTDQTVTVGDTVNLDGSNSSDPDTGDSIASYAWTLDSVPTNSGATLTDAATATPSFTADVAGDYVLTLTVTDQSGATGTDTVTITAQSPTNTAPVANDDAFSTDEDVAAIFDVVGNDTDADNDSLTLTAITVDPTNGTASIASNQIDYTPDANFNGTDTLTYEISDGNGGTDTATLTITVNAVNDAPTAAAGADQTVTTGTLVNLDGSNSSDIDSGDSIASYAWTIDSAPTNSTATLTDAATATPSFTPDEAGDYVLLLTVEDQSGATGTDTVTITAQASANNDPVTTDDTLTLDEDTTQTIDVAANDTDADGDSLTVSIVTGPTNGTASVVSNQIEYTPDANFNGSDSLTYQVADGNGGTATGTLSITVDPVNDAPTANAGADLTVNEGDVVNLNGANSSDIDTGDSIASYAWTLDTKPTNSTATLTDAATATPSFTADVAGDYVLTLTVTDQNAATATDTVTVTAQAVNTAPVANDDTLTLDEDTTALADVLSNDTDADNDTLSISAITAGPTNGTASIVSGQIEYSPDADFNGSDSLTYEISDGNSGTDTATLTITVNAVNDAPTADAGADQTVNEGDVVNLDGSNSSDPDTGDSIASYAWTLDTTPSSSTAALTDANTATPSFTADVPGDYVLTLTVTDQNAATATDTVTVTAQAVNTAPVANDDTFSTDEDVSATFDVVGNDTDADSDSLTLTAITTGPTNGTASITNNQIDYTPDANFNGTDTLTYEISDGNGGTDTATLTITVNAVNDAPTADAGADQTVTTGTLVNLDGSNSSDIDSGDSIAGYAWTIDSAPTNSTATLTDAATATPSFTPDEAGDYVLLLTVEDQSGATGTDTVTITAQVPNSDPVTTDDTLTLDEDTTQTIDVAANDTDADGDSLTVSIVTGPTNGTASVVSNQIEYTPNANFNGSDSLTYQVADGNGGTATGTLSITVNAVNDAPTADAGTDQTVTEGDVVNLDGSNSSDIDAGDSIASYAWTLDTKPSSSTATLTDAATATPSFTADVAGDYVLTLTVTDQNTATATDTVTITAQTASVQPSSAGELVISEIMPSPDVLADSAGEWFELYNPSTTTTYNLNGCTIEDLGADSHTITVDVTIAPGEYVTLANSSSPGFTPSYVYGSNWFLSSGDEVVLNCAGTQIDVVNYDGGGFSVTSGASLTLSPASLDATSNDDSTNWCDATTSYNGDLGTPGAANDSCP
ncbi:tandem-95 repeat protein [Persicimonas caeni]|uniref:Intimin n=1 Tax=Persicimonas caeni TaxID=2292766 RepID=A0A4Y6PWF1_PERCE|nr:Ig-like domain-containing protein [Persicimonas caeni]QDG52671.1 tandem-95 repeat protein [Persicimonas caeni]QED33893.1 tandem-95 repeat protein [Persicimonas caeni]